jgi:MoaA/NifB/PqqE/SkfB family radical SAM enzyme
LGAAGEGRCDLLKAAILRSASGRRSAGMSRHRREPPQLQDGRSTNMSSRSALIKHGLREMGQAVREQVYVRAGVDLTKPLAIKGHVNERCNYRCQMCDFWRLKAYKDEMSIDEWRASLLSLKAFIGRYAIQFIGGEPFIKKGFVGLLRFCTENQISAGVITNGSCFTRKIARETVAARPMNVDISVDGAEPEIHDLLRGVQGSFAQISHGLAYLRDERHAQGIEFPIRVKSTINALNFRGMPALAEWAVRAGASSIGFEPLRHWTRETKEHLWIRGSDVEELARAIDAVIEMKRGGAPIETSEARLRNFLPHFRNEKVIPALATCRVGLRDYHIRCDGNVGVCWNFPPIGNVKRQTAEEIWYGAVANEIRSQTVACTVGCAFSCAAHRPLTDRIKSGLLLLGNGGKG